jgi:hypothetical protein
MAGNSKGKVLCGTPLDAGSNKKCTGCGTKNQPIPEEGKVCAKCGKFLAPWCEALVVPGERCKWHVTRQDRHPDAPSDSVSSFISRMSPEDRVAYEEVRKMGLAEISYNLAAIATVRALKEPDEMRIVAAASGVCLDAARVSNLVAKDGDDERNPEDDRVTIVINKKTTSTTSMT